MTERLTLTDAVDALKGLYGLLQLRNASDPGWESNHRAVDARRVMALAEAHGTAPLPETGLKKRIDTILLGALSGGEARYKTSDGYTKWGVVQDDIHQAIEESAVALYASGPLPELPTEDMLAAIHSYGGDESDDWRTSAAIKYANLLKAIPKTVSTTQPSDCGCETVHFYGTPGHRCLHKPNCRMTAQSATGTSKP